ncbi:MICOS complex subunit MIC25 isoform X1 [Myotis myotis]|uniref:Coiled-coil-helix-coiled-coil-helix domain containing 6 n=1 Tax=Myotis myotis TaxID=51298 RepID=A0A7J7VX39_MYOMY|nr:MICOS complex subunit MIC25 isoform X1 [Myotis myotis]KAF6329712.1 coiled-coil-helix-coiled-coil-helix domain containing 6 [Myotis myotis]
MGGTESSEGRRVSFGMDEEERVRVLQGIRLSENVVNRMKDSSQPSQVGQLTLPPAPTRSTLDTSKGPEKDSKLPKSENGGAQQPLEAEEDLLKRYKQKQAIVQDELFQAAMREKEAPKKYRNASLHRGEDSLDQEKQKSALLASELENRESELRRRNAFYKEQLAHIEKKNAEMYKLSSQQFHEAASKMEGTIKPRRLEPVCSELQAQILHCYRDHLHEVLLCSDLVKAYQHCVSAAHKG